MTKNEIRKGVNILQKVFSSIEEHIKNNTLQEEEKHWLKAIIENCIDNLTDYTPESLEDVIYPLLEKLEDE